MNLINKGLYKIWSKEEKFANVTLFKKIKSQKEREEF